jgi:hypothetical protein
MPEVHTSSKSVRKLPPLYDFSTIEDEDDEDEEEVSLVWTASSPTKHPPFVEPQFNTYPVEEGQVYSFVDL